jgi:hypothetical protein
MPTMPTRDQLRREFDAAVQEIDRARSVSILTSNFYTRIGDSVFEAGVSALEDTCAHQSNPEASIGTHRLHVVSAPVGAGKTSFATALIAAVVRHQEQEPTAPFGCLWVVHQMAKADEMFAELNTSDDATYGNFLTKIDAITDERNDLTSQMIGLLEGAAFGNKPINDGQEDDLVKRANQLIDNIEDLAGR